MASTPPLAPASVFLRLGITLVAFMVLIFHLLLTALVAQLKCNGDDPGIWVLTFFSATIAFFFALTLLAARPLQSVVQTLKWGCLPVVGLLPFSLIAVLPILGASTLGGEPICSGTSAYANLLWQRAWAPVQVGLMLLIAVQAARFWSMARVSAQPGRRAT